MEEFGSDTDPLRTANEAIDEETEFLEVNGGAISFQKGWWWWFLVALNTAFLLVGQTIATMVGKFYFDYGGKSKWISTLLQTVAFPLLYIPVFLLRQPMDGSLDHGRDVPRVTLGLVYFFLGVLLVVENLLYSLGLEYLLVSTYSLLCASQLVFNALLSFFINSQKLTILILNSVFSLSLSAVLIALSDSSDDSVASSSLKGNYVTGFICTILASVVYALLLSLVQLSFEKILKRGTFSVVLDLQIYTSVVATLICVAGLFASGDASGLKEEMDGFQKGKVLYVLSLVGTALAWQVSSVGAVGLIFLVSSLFSNAVGMMTLPLIPIIAVITYGERIDGWTGVAMVLSVWGCSSYLYQNYLDEKLEANRNT